MKSLEESRKAIDSLDKELAALFEQRMTESRNIFEYKKAKGLAVSDPGREAEIIEKNAKTIADKEIREYYVNFEKKVISLSNDYQNRMMQGMRVAYSGKPGAFAYAAAQRTFPDATKVAFPNFAGAYQAVSDGVCDIAVLPFENSFAGEVSSVTDLMFSGDLYVNKVVEIEIEHYLMACAGASMEGITKVYSHPQALMQCEAFIKEHGFTPVETPSTADAAKLVSEMNDPTVAAIAGKEAAELYSLELLEARINSSNTNATRFAIFSKALNLVKDKRKMGKRFILMFTVKNEAGALAKALNIVGAHNYNMCNLHSRPMKTLMWNYYFFLELEGDIATEEGSDMLRELGSICDRLKLVGSWFKQMKTEKQ